MCYWKSPRAIHYVRSNSPTSVRAATRKALTTRSERRRLEALVQLQGVSIPMASAILMLLDPKRYGVIDIRVWQLLHEVGAVTTKPAWGWVQLQELVPVPGHSPGLLGNSGLALETSSGRCSSCTRNIRLAGFTGTVADDQRLTMQCRRYRRRADGGEFLFAQPFDANEFLARFLAMLEHNSGSEICNASARKLSQSGIGFSVHRWSPQLDLDRGSMFANYLVLPRIRNNVKAERRHWNNNRSIVAVAYSQKPTAARTRFITSFATMFARSTPRKEHCRCMICRPKFLRGVSASAKNIPIVFRRCF